MSPRNAIAPAYSGVVDTIERRIDEPTPSAPTTSDGETVVPWINETVGGAVSTNSHSRPQTTIESGTIATNSSMRTALWILSNA